MGAPECVPVLGRLPHGIEAAAGVDDALVGEAGLEELVSSSQGNHDWGYIFVDSLFSVLPMKEPGRKPLSRLGG